MTQIDFYTQAEDKFHTACRLCGKAIGANNRVHVLAADREAADRFSRLLWSVPPVSFVPHCAAQDELAARTPVIVDHRDGTWAHDDVLINLTDTLPASFSRFRRMIEIVTRHDDDRARARERFRHYRDRGYEIATHDLVAPRAARS